MSFIPFTPADAEIFTTGEFSASLKVATLFCNYSHVSLLWVFCFLIVQNIYLKK